MSGPVGVRYYEGESNMPSVIPITDHGTTSLLESVGHFCGRANVVRIMNWLHNLSRGMHALYMHYLDHTLVTTRLLSSEAWEWWSMVRRDFPRIVAAYATSVLHSRLDTPENHMPSIHPRAYRAMHCILCELETHMNIEVTIDIAYDCERLVANPPPLDIVCDVNMEDVEEEEENEDDEESSTARNH
ncbi:hypothetical protein SAY87_021387 [Trapa incisa]|uniref:Uncharacterized protein n=1 Tax=Trapa incisa TaxID=236973 RepID=A0AAN7JRX7_9MYRT|nr:hypothetical protein SAY87_021387 [Trapa incisa]